MRKRKYVVGVALALAVSLVTAGIAQAQVTRQLTVKAAPIKQIKKKHGGTSLDVTIGTTFPVPTNPAQTDQHTDLDLARDFRFFPGKLRQCNSAQLANTTTEAAIAACGRAQVGTGDATVCSSSGGCGALSIPGVVTAFNGPPSARNPTLLLHVKLGGLAAAVPNLVLNGQLVASPLGNPFGRRLAVDVPDTSAQGVKLTNFHVFIPKKVTKKANKKKGKPARFYVEARCSSKTWMFQATSSYRAGGGTVSGDTTQACKQKKQKRKK